MAQGRLFSIEVPDYITAMQVALVNIRWVAPVASSGAQCKVVDNFGNLIYQAFATGSNFIDAQKFDAWPLLSGFNVVTLDTGTLTVEFK